MSVFYFIAMFNKDVDFKDAWGYGNNAHYFMGEKTKCMISNHGIRFGRLDERGQEIYSFPFSIDRVADCATLEPFNKVSKEESDKQKILEFIDDVEKEHPYKVYGMPETYNKYNEAWCDALDRVRCFIESM